MCAHHGSLTPASVVDHIVPHKGDQRLFWSHDNWQSLCKSCHDSHKQRQERSGTVLGSDAAGCPIDDAHHWNAPK
jgi:5-methylcytosine-specific restriction endonuclease McrA